MPSRLFWAVARSRSPNGRIFQTGPIDADGNP